MGTPVPGPSSCLPGTENSEGSSPDLGLWTSLSCQRALPPILGAWLGLELVSWAFLHLPAELLAFGQLLRLGTLRGRCAHSSLLPCPALSSGMDALPALTIVCGAADSLSPAQLHPLPARSVFLIAAPTTHLHSGRSPSSSSLPPSSGVGLKKKANLTAALLS